MSLFKRKKAADPLPAPTITRTIIFAEEGSLKNVPEGVEVVYVEKGAQCPTQMWVS